MQAVNLEDNRSRRDPYLVATFLADVESAVVEVLGTLHHPVLMEIIRELDSEPVKGSMITAAEKAHVIEDLAAKFQAEGLDPYFYFRRNRK